MLVLLSFILNQIKCRCHIRAGIFGFIDDIRKVLHLLRPQRFLEIAYAPTLYIVHFAGSVFELLKQFQYVFFLHDCFYSFVEVLLFCCKYTKSFAHYKEK